MNTPLFLSVLALGAILPNGYAQAPAQTPPQVEMKPTKVALFKNGFGFFSFEGKMPKSNRVELTNLPIPSFGTFWMNASAPTEIVKLTSAPVKTKIKVDSGDFHEIAQANIGKTAYVTRRGSDGKNGEVDLYGVIVSVSSAPKPGNPNLIGSIAEAGGENGRMIVLSREGNEPNQFSYVYIPANDIVGMVFEGADPANKAEREVEKTTLYVDTKNSSEGILAASCLVKGISWVPEYKMELDDSGKAWFQAQALVMNDLMDMEQVDMSFVSGFPSLKFANVESPLAGKYKTLDDFLSSLDMGKGQGNSRMRGQMLRNFSGGIFASGAIKSEQESNSSPNEMVQAEDLFFYPIKNFSCKYGESVLVPLFGGEVPYKHLYIWDIPEQRQLIEWDRQFDSGDPSAQDTSRDIWHSVRFTNKFSVPLTTGALEFTSKTNGNIAGQGVVTFTSPGQEATVRVNKTMQVATTREEKTVTAERKEVKRTSGSSSFYSVSTIEGTLTMKNYSGKTMLMEITKRVLGTPVSASGEGTFSSTPGWNSMNPNGKFKWTTEVKPGETKTLTYQYSFVE